MRNRIPRRWKVMKYRIFRNGLLFVGFFLTLVGNGWGVAWQAAKPANSASKADLTSQQLAALKLASANLLRGYSDLLATPPDVKGDTSKLEGHMKAAMNALHSIDPAAIPAPPSNVPIEDKGHTRAFILSAVKGHLDKAQGVIQGSKVSNNNTKE